jgi:choice-of-anchor C domain-containing protein
MMEETQMTRVLVLIGVVCVLGATPAMAALMVTNGSFEDPVVPVGTFLALPAGSLSLTGWTITGGGVDLVQTTWNSFSAQDGLNSVDLNRLSPGSISQSISFPSAGTYQLSFYMAGNPTVPGTKNMDVALGSLVTDSLSYADPGMNWTLHQYSFAVPGAGNQTLTFTSTAPPGKEGPAVDNVSIQEVVVPLPGAALLGLLGLGAAGIKLRRLV